MDSNRFTCPVHGLYAFSVSIFQSFDYDNAIAASIMVDDVGEIAEVRNLFLALIIYGSTCKFLLSVSIKSYLGNYEKEKGFI